MSRPVSISGENYDCFPLNWDTNYFNIKSARVNLKEIVTKENQEKIMTYCDSFEFITIANIGNDKENNLWIGKTCSAFLTDINIQFSKKIGNKPDYIDEFTEIYNNYPKNEKVLNIAKNTFLYSRFFNDPLLPGKEAKNIYLHWTECAFSQANKYFVITKRKNVVAGYLLFSIDKEKNFATIELISVDDNYQGQKVGKSMIAELESFAYKEGLGHIRVGTQVDNIDATQFYINCGFHYINCSTVYHLWNLTNKR
ncbi:MAG: GNAT family N-acetyltransferase [Alkaliphilus sp.]